MYLTPVVYSLEFVPAAYRSWFMLNPMAFCVESYRRALLHGQPPELSQLMVAALVSFLLFLSGWLFFRKLESMFSDFV
jgi:ABC-type polysaccharide/polyol phosphate export permease